MEFNKDVKDKDALYKFLTYSGMLEKKRREDINKTRKDNVVAFGIHNFEEFYKEQLLLDAKKPAREIKPEEYKPVRGMDATLMEADVFRNNKEREQDYFKDFEIYKENKSKLSLFVLTPFSIRGIAGQKPVVLHSGAVLLSQQDEP